MHCAEGSEAAEAAQAQILVVMVHSVMYKRKSTAYPYAKVVNGTVSFRALGDYRPNHAYPVFRQMIGR